MYTKSGWLTAKGVTYFFIFIFVSVILATLSSCSKADSTYYLQVVENDNFQQVQVIDQDSTICAVIDASIPLNDSTVAYDLQTQFGYSSVFEASYKYWIYKNN